MFVSRHVQFVESVFPYRSLNTTLDRPSTTTINSWVPSVLAVPSPQTDRPTSPPSAVVSSHELSPCEAPTVPLQEDSSQFTVPAVSFVPVPLQLSSSASATPLGSLAPPVATAASDSVAQATAAPPTVIVPVQQQPPSSVPSSSTTAAAVESAPQVANPVHPSLNDHAMITRAKDNIHKPIQKLNLHTELQPLSDSEPTTALRFYGSFNVTVTGITIQNSPQCHLKFDNCVGVMVLDISISSPGDSPNTDGIH
ncbi:hypothetical protein LWI29_016265 [Acer saccharum]|uniref:Uncharacterized protein n=1 Tax=Acer saccharum TaxID=4024 RepID=A0AA39SVJ2_ACESA|nr:hypothetical protein LWI29_016265 [Acer saccharum]